MIQKGYISIQQESGGVISVWKIISAAGKTKTPSPIFGQMFMVSSHILRFSPLYLIRNYFEDHPRDRVTGFSNWG